jgi:hypothetical protein
MKKIDCTFHLCQLEAKDAMERRNLSAEEVQEAILAFYTEYSPAERIHGEGESKHNDRQLLHYVSESGGIIRGVAFDWEQDAHAETIHIPTEGAEVHFETIGVEKQKGDKVAEFVRSTAAFAIKGDYVAHCEKNARVSLLQETLSYVLSKQFERTIQVEFIPLPSRELTDELLNRISDMEVKHDVDAEHASPNRYQYTTGTQRFLPKLMGDICKKFTEDISGDLELKFSIKVKNKHHLTGESRRIMSQLARIFIDLPYAKIRLNDNSYLTREKMQISQVVKVDARHRNPVYDTLLMLLSDWLEKKLPSNAGV